MGIPTTALALTALAGCLHAPPLPPTAGYGDPYKGTGEGIYVKDSRTDWEIREGKRTISSEQALEAAGDEEYEARRQIAKAHNARLYREAVEHQRSAYYMIGASTAAIVIGFVAQFIVAPRLQHETSMAAGPGMPETRTYESGFSTNLLATFGGIVQLTGLAAIPYAYIGGRRTPPYHVWRTPDPLNRPAYVRQQTEPYNERIGAPSLPDEAPAQLKLPGPPERRIPRPRGGR